MTKSLFGKSRHRFRKSRHMVPGTSQIETWSDRRKYEYLMNSLGHAGQIWSDTIREICLSYLLSLIHI